MVARPFGPRFLNFEIGFFKKMSSDARFAPHPYWVKRSSAPSELDGEKFCDIGAKFPKIDGSHPHLLDTFNLGTLVCTVGYRLDMCV